MRNNQRSTERKGRSPRPRTFLPQPTELGGKASYQYEGDIRTSNGSRPPVRSTSRNQQINASNGLVRQRTASCAPSYMSDLNQAYEPFEIKHLPWSRRLKHVTWAYFTLTMATGGIANALNAVPFRFRGLYTIGLVIFLTNIVLYLVIWAMILTRFILYPHSFRDSLTHPTESLFVPAFVVSFGTILITIVEYGADHIGEWLTRTLLALFWCDCAMAVILSLTIYMILWSTTSFTIDKMTPIWIFPAYPLLIIGPHAANLSPHLSSPKQAIQVIIGGFTIQGIGFLVSLTIYSAFVYRLMTEKLPSERLRPGMFVSVGPSAFTVSGTIGMAQNLHRTVATQDTFMQVPGLLASQILSLVANFMSLWLWGLAIWFFFISLVSNMQCFQPEHHVPFAMTWFSFVFPQTALVTATFAIAKAFDIQALRIVGCAMTVLLVIVWAFVLGMMIRAILRKDILWPEKGEDKEEGGFRKRFGKRDVEDVEATAAASGVSRRDIALQVMAEEDEERDGEVQDLRNEVDQDIANGLSPVNIPAVAAAAAAAGRS